MSVGSRTDPYTSKSGEVIAARHARTNIPERLIELKQAQARCQEVIRQGRSCKLAHTAQKDKYQRFLDQLSPIAILTGQKHAVHDQDEKIRGHFHPIDDFRDALPVELAATLDRIRAARTSPAFRKGGPGAKRQGAKAVKKLEPTANAAHMLSSEEASLYMALVARVNFLSQDRVDIDVSTKEPR